jgi:hypothetical protein
VVVEWWGAEEVVVMSVVGVYIAPLIPARAASEIAHDGEAARRKILSCRTPCLTVCQIPIPVTVRGWGLFVQYISQQGGFSQ